MAKAQGGIKPPVKNKTVKVSKDGKHLYSFDYADLSGVIECLREPLTTNGLWFMQSVSPDGLVTKVIHESGQSVSTTIPMPRLPADPKAAGGQLTYFKRYALAATFGVASEEDDDGNRAAGDVPKVSNRKPAQKKPPVNNRVLAAPAENQETLKRTLKELGVKTKKDSTEAVAFISKDPSMTHAKVFDGPDDHDAASILGLIQIARNNGTEGEALWKTPG